MSFESVLPSQNLEAEQCVLGSMLLDREAIGEVLLILEADDFYEPRHGELFHTLCVLYDRRRSKPFTPSLSMRHIEAIFNATTQELNFARARHGLDQPA